MQVLETFEYEPIFMDFLSLDEIEARIILVLISQGGFTTKNHFETHLFIERPTLNRKLQTLAKKKLIRQNLEFKVKRITLRINLETLLKKIVELHDKTNFALKFILESQTIKSKSLIRSRFKDAIKVLLPTSRYDDLLAEVLTILYVDQIQNNKTITLKRMNSILKAANQHFSENYLVQLLSNMTSFIRFFSGKMLESESNSNKIIRPLFPLETLAKYLLNEKQFYLSFCENTFIQLFENFEFLPSNQIPHQVLTFHSDLKKRINSCLPFATAIFLLFNSINEIEVREFLQLLLDAKKFRNRKDKNPHEIFLLIGQNIAFPNSICQLAEVKKISILNNKDYRERNFIVFYREENVPFGAIIFPLKPLNPYYTITENALEEINNFFTKFWRN